MTNPYTFNRDTGKYALTTGHLTPEQLEFENTWAVNKAELPGELYSLQTPEQLLEGRWLDVLAELAFYRRANVDTALLKSVRYTPGPTDSDVLELAKHVCPEFLPDLRDTLSETAPYTGLTDEQVLQLAAKFREEFREDFLKEVGLRVEGTFP